MRARLPLPVPLTTLLLTVLLPAGTALAQETPVLRPTVTARFPHDHAAFTQGLQYLGQSTLIESTGQVGSSGVRQVDLRTGRVLKDVPTPIASAFGEGVTVLKGVAYHITWQTGVAFAFDAATLREVGRYRYRGEGWGLTNDGKQLIMSDGSSTLFWRDSRTFAVTRTVRVTDGGQPVKNLNELEYVQGSIYANIWLTNRIARIDPRTGKVTAWLDVQPLMQEASAEATRAGHPLTFDDVPNGIAFVPERGTLLLTGKRWPVLFEVRVPGVKPEASATGRAASPR
ncbi:glutaminyl-peptide cyclotransferase [Deinococcus sp. YIM 77859]|uniref:glutaminyl-peptide cyclotransferase n=1 Tax=Deinococcus sp. YIM 77859 TaxID=1540221 RepID=UPI0009DD5CFA|nr:glutaminyl-peptide cyclotransferase [Deinococcus sp. YIM 77859]